MSENLKQIGGRTVSVGMMPPTVAVPVQVKLATMLGGSIVRVAQAKGKNLTDDEIGAALLDAITAKLDPDATLDTVKTVMQYVTVEGKPVRSIDETFVGRNLELWQVFVYALQVNFGDFFDGARSILRSGQMAETPQQQTLNS